MRSTWHARKTISMRRSARTTPIARLALDARSISMTQSILNAKLGMRDVDANWPLPAFNLASPQNMLDAKLRMKRIDANRPLPLDAFDLPRPQHFVISI